MAEQVVQEKKVVSSSGSKFYTPIEYFWDDKVKFMVPKEGKKQNRYEMIQASKASCDINVIVKRALAGDPFVLNVRTSINNGSSDIVDVSDVPTNFNDIHNVNINAINQFAALDNNIKKLFDNDFNKFNQAVMDGSYVSIIQNAFSNSNDNEIKESEESK